MDSDLTQSYSAATGRFEDKQARALMAAILAVLLVLPQLQAAVDEAGTRAAKPAASKVVESGWERVVMIGASATAGFTAFEPFGGTNTQQLRLHRYLEAALAGPHQAVRNLGEALFFTQPEVLGPRQIQQALKPHPTLVVGADFLFWFCYGDGATEADRLRRFERGLGMLESVKCPLLLGDLPDASAAVGLMLRAEQVPSGQTLATANRRLKEWAAARPHVVVLSLSNFMYAVMTNAPLTLHGTTIPAGKTRGLLQFDKLHPAPSGCAALALAIVDALQQAKPKEFSGEIRWDRAEVVRRAVSFNDIPQANAERERSPIAPANGK